MPMRTVAIASDKEGVLAQPFVVTHERIVGWLWPSELFGLI